MTGASKKTKENYDVKYAQQLKMFEAIIKFVDEHSSAIASKKYESPTSDYIEILRVKYENGNLLLSEDKIERLLELGILLPTGKWKEASEKYNISRQIFKYIIAKYGDIDNFINGYKNGDFILSKEEMEECGIYNPQGIVLSPYDISVTQKRAYIDLMKDICTEEQINSFYGDGCKRGYININDIEQLLQNLSEEQRKLIVKVYGLRGKGCISLSQISIECGKKLEVISQELEDALELLKSKCSSLVKNQDTAYNAERRLKNWQPNIGIESLNFTEATYNALQNIGIKTISDLNNLSQKVLMQALTQEGIKEIEEKYSSMQVENLEEESKEDLRFEVRNLRQENSAFAQSYYNLMYYESIFDPNQVIKATITKIPIIIEHKEDLPYIQGASRLRELSAMKAFLEEKYSGIRIKSQNADYLLEELQGDLLKAGIIVDSSRTGEEI